MEYKRSAEEDSGIFSVYNMERLGELDREESESPFSGKTAVVDSDDGLHYISYYYDDSGEQGNAPVLDEKKYILLGEQAPPADNDPSLPGPSDPADQGTFEKEAPAHTHTPGEWAVEKEATGSEDGRIAAVTKSGKITGKKTGAAKIIVTTKKEATASVKVKVQKGIVKAQKVTVKK